jgi:uncharacterized damage-inducible protein DinB
VGVAQRTEEKRIDTTPSNGSALQAEELLAWNDHAAQQWRAFASANPAVLNVPCDIYRAKTVGELLQHLVAVELRYAERLSGVPTSDYAALPFGSAEEIFSTHDRALELFRNLLKRTNIDWYEKLEFTTLTAGTLRAPRRAMLFHAMLHAIRHYAQLSTLVRQAGFPTGFAGDYLFMDAERAEPPSPTDRPSATPPTNFAHHGNSNVEIHANSPSQDSEPVK